MKIGDPVTVVFDCSLQRGQFVREINGWLEFETGWMLFHRRPNTEGDSWCRGHDGEDVRALAASIALGAVA